MNDIKTITAMARNMNDYDALMKLKKEMETNVVGRFRVVDAGMRDAGCEERFWYIGTYRSLEELHKERPAVDHFGKVVVIEVGGGIKDVTLEVY